MKILITGGAGFIGSHLAEHYQGRAEVRVLDNLRTGFRENLHGVECTFIEDSITRREAVREAMEGVDYVFHLAALVSVPESVEQPLECLRINAEGTLIVLEEAARAGVRKLCFSSSAAVYGDDPEVPKEEGMRPQPRSPYAVTKLDGEFYCSMFKENGRLDTACLRYFNVFGPRQDPGSAYAAAVPIFIEQALSGRDLTVYGDGSQTRDFVYVKDVVAANAYFAEHASPREAYNVGYGSSMTVGELAQRILTKTASPSRVVHAEARAGDVKHSRADVQRLAAAGLALSPRFDEGLDATIAYFKDR